MLIMYIYVHMLIKFGCAGVSLPSCTARKILCVCICMYCHQIPNIHVTVSRFCLHVHMHMKTKSCAYAHG